MLTKCLTLCEHFVSALRQVLVVVGLAGDGGQIATLTARTRDAAHKKIRHTFQFIYPHRGLNIFLFHMT